MRRNEKCSALLLFSLMHQVKSKSGSVVLDWCLKQFDPEYIMSTYYGLLGLQCFTYVVFYVMCLAQSLSLQ